MNSEQTTGRHFCFHCWGSIDLQEKRQGADVSLSKEHLRRQGNSGLGKAWAWGPFKLVSPSAEIPPKCKQDHHGEQPLGGTGVRSYPQALASSSTRLAHCPRSERRKFSFSSPFTVQIIILASETPCGLLLLETPEFFPALRWNAQWDSSSNARRENSSDLLCRHPLPTKPKAGQSSRKLPVSLNLGDGRTPFCQWLLSNDGVYVASHFSPSKKWPQTCYSTAYCTKGPFFLEKKNTVLVMIAHVILTRILEFEILKCSSRLSHPSMPSYKWGNWGSVRPYDLCKALQLISIPWNWSRNLQVLVQSFWGSR